VAVTWPDTVPVLVAAVAILFAPGLAAGAALGLRRLTLLAIAPAFTITIIALAATANQVVDFRWGFGALAVATALVSAIVLGLRLLWQRRWPRPVARPIGRSAVLATAAGLLFAFAVIAVRFAAMFQAPSRVSQTFDNIYHLNAVRWILDTGIVSPLKIGGLSYQFDGRTSFYPDMWHALVSLAVQASGAPIPVAVNVTNIAIGAMLWPLACVFLVRQVAGPRPVALVSAGVLSASFAAFPYLMVDFGVLYPNLLSIGLLPAALAAVVIVARVGVAPPLAAPAGWVALAGTLPGLALAHPTTLMALVVFSLPVGVQVLARHLRGLRARRAPTADYVRRLAVAGAGFGGAAIALLVVRPPGAAFWPPRESLLTALHGVVAGAVVGRPAAYVIGALLVLGLITVIRRRAPLWLAGSYALGAALYVIVASFPQGSLRTGFTGIWYNDSFRVAALLPVVVLPLAAIGAAWLADAISSAIHRRPNAPEGGPDGADGAGTVATRPTTSARLAVTGLPALSIVVVLALSAQSGPALAFAMDTGRLAYRFDAESPLLSPDELVLLGRLDSEVPEDATVVGSPWTGTSLVYALSDRRALIPHVYGERDTDTLRLMRSLRDAEPGTPACEAVADLDARYVLDFGDREIHGGDSVIAGLEDLGESAAVELVDSEGDARLYRVTACG